MANKVVFESSENITAYDLAQVLEKFTEDELRSMELLGGYRNVNRITADKELETVNMDIDYIG